MTLRSLFARKSPRPLVVNRNYRPQVEVLEDRQMLAANPFDSTQFQTAMTALLQNAGVPLASLALMRNGETFTWDNSGAIDKTALFRIGSVSKSFCATIIMKLAQDGFISLNDKFMTSLGFFQGEILTGFNPVDGVTPIGAALPQPLFNITIKQLLQMSAGLPLNVPVASLTYPSAGLEQAIYNAGSYAALAFAGQPPYTTGPATVQQQMRYYLYQVSARFAQNPIVYNKPDAVTKQDAGDVVLLKPGSYYKYNDTNYALLGMLAEKVIQQQFGLTYGAYLQQQILTPMGIAAPTTNPAVPAMVGIGRTLLADKYPTEVEYHSYPDEHPAPSIFPDPAKTTAPFYPTDGNGDPIKEPLPYGGAFYIESHFGEGGLVATPTALVRFFDNLQDTLAGAPGGPLKQKTVQIMTSKPAAPLQADLGNNAYFGMGFGNYPKNSQLFNGGNAWFKGGDLPGNSALLWRYHDGTVWAATFNADVLGDPLVENAFAVQFRALVDGATYGPRTVSILKGSPQTAGVGKKYTTDLLVLVQDNFGKAIKGIQVSFIAPTTGPSGTFVGGVTTLNVLTDSKGRGLARMRAGQTVGAFVVEAKAQMLFPPSPNPISYAFLSTGNAAFQMTVV